MNTMGLLPLSRMPLRLAPDNFTPPNRTPWGGRTIVDSIKRGLSLRNPQAGYALVGESWEASTDPSFPGDVCFDNTYVSLSRILADEPEDLLGKLVSKRCGAALPVLLKIIDAADQLSIQLHPKNDFAGLRDGECGKWECWYILRAEPGSHVLMGLKPGVSARDLQLAAEQHADLSHLLNRVDVSPGDFITIPEGTIHSIGKGLTLLEVQRTAPKKSGVTYRVWDWNRRYSADGTSSPSGQRRALHIEETFAVLSDSNASGHMRTPAPVGEEKHGVRQLYRASDLEINIQKIASNTRSFNDGRETFSLLHCFEGSGMLTAKGFEMPIRKGETLFIPALAKSYEIHAVSDISLFNVAVPS